MTETKKLELTPTCHLEATYYEGIRHMDVTLEYVEHSQDHWHSDSTTSIAIDAEMARKIIAFLAAEHGL